MYGYANRPEPRVANKFSRRETMASQWSVEAVGFIDENGSGPRGRYASRQRAANNPSLRRLGPNWRRALNTGMERDGRGPARLCGHVSPWQFACYMIGILPSPERIRISPCLYQPPNP